jgi:hypothetical protein
MRVTLLKTIANFKNIQNEKEDQNLSALFYFTIAFTALCSNTGHRPGYGCRIKPSSPGSYRYRTRD